MCSVTGSSDYRCYCYYCDDYHTPINKARPGDSLAGEWKGDESRLSILCGVIIFREGDDMPLSSPLREQGHKKNKSTLRCDRLDLDLRKGKRLMGGESLAGAGRGDSGTALLSVASPSPGPQQKSCPLGPARSLSDAVGLSTAGKALRWTRGPGTRGDPPGAPSLSCLTHSDSWRCFSPSGGTG